MVTDPNAETSSGLSELRERKEQNPTHSTNKHNNSTPIFFAQASPPHPKYLNPKPP